MERKVTINDPGLETLVDAVSMLASHVATLYDIVHRHRHFTNGERPGDIPGEWTDLNDAIRDADLANVKESLDDIRVTVEGLRQS